MDGRLTWTGCDVVPNVLSPRDLVCRPDSMYETVPHTLWRPFSSTKKGLNSIVKFIEIMSQLFEMFENIN